MHPFPFRTDRACRSAVFLLAAAVAASPSRAAGSVGADFQALPPCRVLDTRSPAGPLGGPALLPGVPRAFVLANVCGVPVGALAVSVNATVTNTTGTGFLVLYAGDVAAPSTSNLNFGKGQTRAGASLVGVAPDGTLEAMTGGGGADLVLDVNGYFGPPPPAGLVTLDPVADQTIPTLTTLSLRLSGHSTDALAALTYGLVAGPAGTAVSPLGVFSFAPSQGQIGPQSVTVKVRDQAGRSAQRTFQISVVDHDHAPVFGPLPDDLTRVGASYSKTLTATDPDAGDVLTFSLVSGPAGMTLSGQTLAWTPTSAQLGNWPVGVRVTDRAGLSANGQFNVGIQFLVAANDAYSVTLGQILTVNAPGVLANDLDPLSGSLTAAKVTNPDKGTLNSFGADGSFVYQAPPILPGPPFVPAMKWHIDGANVGGIFQETPLVLDVDGDGKPELIVLSQSGGFGIMAVSGTNGTVLWSRAALPTPYNDCTMGGFTGGANKHIAAADIDDSGHVSIVFPTSCGRDNQPTGIVGTVAARYAAINAKDGTFKWLSAPLGTVADANGNHESFASGTTPTLARLRPGETPSILVGRDLFYTDFVGKPECDQMVPGWPSGVGCRGVFVLDGKDGSVRQRMAAPYPGLYPPDAPLNGNGTSGALAADLDGDGSVEIIYGGAVWNNDGSVRWNNADSPVAPCCAVSYWNGLGNFDDTPDIEIVRLNGGGFSGLTRLSVYKSDGTLLWAVPMKSGAVVGIPAIADVDGSGRPSVVFSVDTNVCALDYKGNYKWCHDFAAMTGNPNLGSQAGLQVFDLDGDGVPEVIVPIPGEILVFLDGATGNIKATFDQSAANGPPFLPPYLDYPDGSGGPIVADVDGSGHAAIVSVWGGIARLDVVKSAANDWRPARKAFNQDSYQFGNINDDGSIPKNFFNNFATQSTNVFRNQAQILTPADPLQNQTTSFTYTASDGPLTSAPGKVTITILPPNRPPKFTTSPPTRYSAPDFAFTYAAHAVDSDPGDTVTYSIKATEGNYGYLCTMDPASGVLSCPNLNSGDQAIVIVATDNHGAAGYQSILLRESPGPGTVPNVVGQQQLLAGLALSGAGFGPGNVTKIDDPAPAGEVVQQTPGAGTIALKGSLVDLVVSKGPFVPPPPGPPPGLGNIKRIVVTPASTLHVVGDNVPYRATSVNNDGTGADITAFATWSSAATGVATVNAAGVAHAAGAGTTTLTAAAGGLSGQASLVVSARANGDFTLPTAVITQPASGGTVTGQTQILGTATDTNFLRYELALEASGEATFTTFGRGTAQVTNGVLATLDPTLLLNGAYTLRLTVFDRNGNTATADVPFVADGFMKVGNFTFAYTDLTVPLPGVSIQLQRLYDSRDKGKGDFGIGWRLGVSAHRLSTSGILGTKWQVVQQGGTQYALVPGTDHFVSVALPNGKVETFDLRISPSSSFLTPFSTLFATFVPRSGTLGTLQSLENVNLLILDPQPGPVTLVDDSLLATFNPNRFLYTQLDGTQIVLSRTNGVESVRDTNGNQITIGAGGITHSSGAAVTFTRDGGGRITGITDPSGQSHSYGYTPSGDLASHTDAAAATTSYFYDANHGLVRIVDPIGRPTARAEYDDAGRLQSMTDAAGHTVTYGHDLPGQQEQVVDALGRVTLLNYDERGNVLARTDALGGVTTWTYDDQDNETSHTDPDGRTVATTYAGVLPLKVSVDPAGLNLTTTNVFNPATDPTSVTDPGGRVFSFAYDGSRNLTQLTTPDGGPVTAVLDTRGLAMSVTDALGTSTVTTRDASGNPTRQDVRDAGSNLLRRSDATWDANGRVLTRTAWRTFSGVLTPLTTTFAYDAAGRSTSVTDAAGGVRHFEYDAAGQQTAVVDALGRRTTYVYDELGRNVLTTHPDGTTEAVVYDAAGNVASRTDRAGRTTRFTYDALNRLVATTMPDGTSTQTLYTTGGLVAATIDAKGGRTDYTYDTAGRRTGTTLPPVWSGVAGPLVRPQLARALDALGAPTSMTDANGRSTSFLYDAAGRPTRVTFADGTFTTQTFDALGRRTSSTNEEGEATSYSYDALGRLVSVSGLAGDATYTWDESGNLLTQTDALSRTTHLRYDALGRLVQRTYPGGETEQLAFDAVGNAVSLTDPNGKATAVAYDAMNRVERRTFFDGSTVAYTYAADGQRASIVDARGTTIQSYDAAGRLASVLKPTGETLHYGRDANGRILSLASPAASITYAWDALNRLTQVISPEGQANYFYDLAGNRVRLVSANGIVTDTLFDLRYRPTQITHRTPASSLVGSFVNAWSPAGRRTQVDELDGSHVQYVYDAKGRLASETRTGVTPLTITHAFDAAGNRTQTVRNGVATNFSYDTDDRLLGDGTSTYAWDANGNLLSKTTGPASTLYAWDPQNRLASITDLSGTTQYTYDADGNRTQATAPSGTTRFLVDAANGTGLSQVLEERDGTGALQARFAYGNEFLSMRRGGLASFFHADAHGSTRTLTNAAAAPTDNYTFDAFGRTVNAVGTTANANLYGGERFDAAFGLYQLRARYYAPDLGRFISRDPRSGRLDAPATLNRYVYAGADPVNAIDPTGQLSVTETLFASFQAIGLDAAELAGKAVAACTAYTTLEEINDYVFVGRVGLGLAMVASNIAVAANFGFTDDFKHVFSPDGPVGFSTEATANWFDEKNELAKAGSLRRVTLGPITSGGAGGAKLALDVAGPSKDSAGTIEFEVTGPPLSLKGAGGAKLKTFSKKFGCSKLAFGEISIEGSAKVYGGGSGEKGGLVGGAVEIAAKLELFGGLLNGSLPLVGFDLSESYKQGFSFSITLGGFVVNASEPAKP